MKPPGGPEGSGGHSGGKGRVGRHFWRARERLGWMEEVGSHSWRREWVGRPSRRVGRG